MAVQSTTTRPTRPPGDAPTVAVSANGHDTPTGAGPPSAPRSDAVELWRSGQYTVIMPPVAGLGDALYTVSHELAAPPGRAPLVVPRRDPLVWETKCLERPVQECFAGMEPLVRELLERSGLAVRLRGTRPAPLPAPEMGAVTALGPADVAVLDFVRSHDRGLVRPHRPGLAVAARLVAQVALAWPRKRIVVVAAHAADARRVARLLRAYGVRAGLSTRRDGEPRSSRVVVATPSRLGNGLVGVERRDVYVALGPAELFNAGAAYAWGIDGIKALRRARAFGVLAHDARPAPRARDLITALFGQDQVVVPRHGYVPVEVAVAFTRVRGGARVPDHRDDAVVKRLGVHEHHLRNRRVAQLARALAAGDGETLLQKFPDVARHVEGRRVGRVGVYVDQVAHGLALAALLGWPLVAADKVWKAGLTDEGRATLKRGRDERARAREHVVVTPDGLALAGRFDVMVRADGGTGLPGLPENLLRVKHGRRARLLLIDCRDEHHPLLRRWGRQRRAAYAAAGWAGAGEPALGALDRFLATRPEVAG